VDSVVRFAEPLVGAEVEGGGDFSGGRLGGEDFAVRLEGADDFDAEVDVHGQVAGCGVVVEEDVVSVGAEAGVAAEEVPDLIEGGLPGVADFGDADVAADGGESAGGGGFDGDVHCGKITRG